MKTIIFLGDSRDVIRTFPEAARRHAGRQLLRLQSGLDPEDWKPMATVGKGTREVRIQSEGNATSR